MIVREIVCPCGRKRAPVHRVKPARKQLVLPVALREGAHLGCGCVEWTATTVPEVGAGVTYRFLVHGLTSRGLCESSGAALHAVVGVCIGYTEAGELILTHACVGGPVSRERHPEWPLSVVGEMLARFEYARRGAGP